MGRRRKPKPLVLSRTELVELQVDQLLKAETITPKMVFDLLTLGSQLYKSGLGIPAYHVWEAVISGFKQNGREYLTPAQMSTLLGISDDTSCSDDDVAKIYNHLEQ